MDSAELDLARLSQHLAMVGIQAARAYNDAQNQLDLAHVVAGKRLTSPAGRVQSRQTLAQVAELTAQHKAMFSRFIAGTTEQLMASAQQLTESRRAAFSESLACTINRNLGEQAKFYEGRERWINAALRALDLAEQHEGDIWIEDEVLTFSTDALVESFSAIFATMNEVHEEESALMQARQAHIAATLSGAG